MDVLGVRGQYECDVHISMNYRLSAVLVFINPTYPAMVRLLGEDPRLASSDGEVGLRDLEDLSVV